EIGGWRSWAKGGSSGMVLDARALQRPFEPTRNLECRWRTTSRRSPIGRGTTFRASSVRVRIPASARSFPLSEPGGGSDSGQRDEPGEELPRRRGVEGVVDVGGPAHRVSGDL